MECVDRTHGRVEPVEPAAVISLVRGGRACGQWIQRPVGGGRWWRRRERECRGWGRRHVGQLRRYCANGGGSRLGGAGGSASGIGGNGGGNAAGGGGGVTRGQAPAWARRISATRAGCSRAAKCPVSGSEIDSAPRSSARLASRSRRCDQS